MPKVIALGVDLWFCLLLSVPLGCGGAGPSPTSPACDQGCEDAVALRAFRETLKQVFNASLLGAPVGMQDKTVMCEPFGGSAHVTGVATSDANVGATMVTLTYVLDRCRYLSVDTDPTQNYDMTLSGTITERGVIAVQPGTATALTITSGAVTFSGTVYNPPLPYPGRAAQSAFAPDGGAGSVCPVKVAQNGNQLSGLICGRMAGVSL